MKLFKDSKIRYSIIAILCICIIIFINLNIDGMNIFSFNPSDAKLNDEVMYLKQVQSVLYYGYPQGYFGYDLSHARIGTFGSWSPIIFYLYLIPAFIFKSSGSYIVYFSNIFMIISSVLFFVLNTKYENGKIAFFLIPFASIIFSRYAYSGMVEPLFHSILVIIMTCFLNRDSKKFYFIGLLTIFIASLMRPYFSVFFVLFLFKNNSFKEIFQSVFKVLTLMIITLIGFIGITKLFTAPFFADSSMIPDISLVVYIIEKIRISIELSLQLATNNFTFTNIDSVGIIYTCYYFNFLFLIIYLIYKIIKKAHSWADLFALIIYIVGFISVAILYSLGAGSRTIYLFILFIQFYIIADILKNKQIKSLWIVFIFIVILPNFLALKNNFQIETNKYSIYRQDIEKITIESFDANDNTLVFEYGIDMDLFNALYYVKPGIGINFTYPYTLRNPSLVDYGYVLLSAQSPYLNVYIDDSKFESIVINESFYVFKMKK